MGFVLDVLRKLDSQLEKKNSPILIIVPKREFQVDQSSEV